MWARADTLFLSTIPRLAGIIPVPTTRTVSLKTRCLSLTLEEVTFSGMAADIVQDNGDPYPGPHSTPPQPHWKKTDDNPYTPSPVVLTAGSTMTATATFSVQLEDFSGPIRISAAGWGPKSGDYFPFPITETTFNSGEASVTIPCAATFPENTVGIVDPINVTWGYQTSSRRFKDIGTSTNQVYVTCEHRHVKHYPARRR